MTRKKLLHQLIGEAMRRRGLSLRAAEVASGLRLSRAGINQIVRGNSIWIEPASVTALADTLGIPEQAIRDAARESGRAKDRVWEVAVTLTPENLERWLDLGRALAGSEVDRRTRSGA